MLVVSKYIVSNRESYYKGFIGEAIETMVLSYGTFYKLDFTNTCGLRFQTWFNINELGKYYE